jgi:integrase
VSGFVPIDGHPGFYRNGNLVYFRFRDRRRRLRWDSAQTVKEAERKKLIRELEVERGEYRDGSRELFAGYARSWIETYQGRTSRGIGETTRDDYRRRLEQDAIPFLGRMRLSEIEQRDLKEYVRQLEQQGKAPNTVRLAVAPVRALLATAVEEGVLRFNPAAGLRLAQRRPDSVDGDDQDERERVKAMAEAELAALLAVIDEDAPSWRLFFELLAWSGMRIGELVELRWRDVDLGEQVVRVRRRYFDGRVGPPKTKYGKRTLRLTPPLARALWRHRAGAKDDELVLTNPGGGRVQQPNLMRRVLKPATVKAGLGEWVREQDGTLRADSWVGFHTFRHTCATLLFRKGWNAKQVQLWLGHHKASFTLDTYVHLLDEDLPVPTFFDAISGRADTGLTQTGLDERNQNEAGEPETGFPPPNARRAETS